MFIRSELTFHFSRNEEVYDYYIDLIKQTLLEEPSDSKYKKIRRYVRRIHKLKKEKNPTNNDLYYYLLDNNYNSLECEPRYIELAYNLLCGHPVSDVLLCMDGHDVKLIFNTETIDGSVIESIKDVKLLLDNGSLGDTFYEGKPGNELIYPSRTNELDALGFIGFEFTCNIV